MSTDSLIPILVLFTSKMQVSLDILVHTILCESPLFGTILDN